MANIAVLCLELSQCIAVLQGNKLLIGVQHILIAAGFLIGRIRRRLL